MTHLSRDRLDLEEGRGHHSWDCFCLSSALYPWCCCSSGDETNCFYSNPKVLLCGSPHLSVVVSGVPTVLDSHTHSCIFFFLGKQLDSRPLSHTSCHLFVTWVNCISVPLLTHAQWHSYKQRPIFHTHKHSSCIRGRNSPRGDICRLSSQSYVFM